MNSISSEREREIFIFLREAQCCSRCCLRFIGFRTTGYYEDPASLFQKLGYDDTSLETPTEATCSVCLGILQDALREESVRKIVERVVEEDYDSDRFSCALTIPIAVQLRERATRISLARKFGDSESNSAEFLLKIPGIKDIWKSLTAREIERGTGKRSDLAAVNSALLIDVFFAYSSDAEECEGLLKMCGSTFEERTTQKRKYSDGVYSRKSVEAALIGTKDDRFAKHYPCPPPAPAASVTLDKVTCTHSSIFIGGRYTKFSRELSQTPWFVNGEKKLETSVQELLCDSIVKYVKADSMKFLSSGREDVDVRNLYAGRPFAVELLNPRVVKISDDALANLVERINASTVDVQIVSRLKVLTREDLKILKEGENVKTKLYRALCVCRTKPKRSLESLNAIKDLEIIQKTPVRVLHRRPLAPRPRTIHAMRARWIRPDELPNLQSDDLRGSGTNIFVLDVMTQAGTYVKEFVHGDFGRTKPSLCELLDSEVDIVALDVTGINLDWL